MMLRYCVGWGGVGWGDNVQLHFLTYMMLRYCASHIWCYVTVWGGVGWGGVITFSCTSSHIWCYVILPHIYDATLLCLAHMMLRCCNIVLDCLSSQIWCYAAVISSCTSAHIWCYAAVISSCDASQIWCYAAVVSSCTSAHIWCYVAVISSCDASQIWCYAAVVSSCTSAHIWCYAAVISSCNASQIWCYVIVPHIYDATLLCLTHMMLRCCNIVLHFRTYMMLRYCASHIWCYAAVISSWRTVLTKTCLSSLHKLSRPLREEKTSAPLGFLTFPLKSTRVLFQEIALSGKCKNTVICGKKWMTKNANVENVGSINNPPGCL